MQKKPASRVQTREELDAMMEELEPELTVIIGIDPWKASGMDFLVSVTDVVQDLLVYHSVVNRLDSAVSRAEKLERMFDRMNYIVRFWMRENKTDPGGFYKTVEEYRLSDGIEQSDETENDQS